MNFLCKRLASEYDGNPNLLMEFCPKIIDRLTLRLTFVPYCLIFENEVHRDVKYLSEKKK